MLTKRDSRKRSLRARENAEWSGMAHLRCRACRTSDREVHLHFTADQSLRADRKDIPHDQHPDHQLRID
jgi:hypothetical protein